MGPIANRGGMTEIIQFNPAYADQVGPFVVGIQHEFGVPITLEQQPDLKDVTAHYIHTGGNFWIARDGEKLVGTIALLDMGGGIGVLRKMFVHPAYRGAPQRVGQHLLDVLLGWARARHFRHLYLGTVDLLVAAQRFYEKNGFRLIPEETLPDPIVRIKMPDDNLYYAMELAA